MKEIDLEFIDSHTDGEGWDRFDPASLKGFRPIKVRGFLLYEDDDWLVAATAVNSDGYSLGRIIVPRVAVVSTVATDS